MKVYVASRFSDEGIAAVRRMYELLRKADHEITLDWTVESADGKVGGESRGYLMECAARDLAAVRKSDALIFLNVDDKTMRGAYIEAGVALGLGKPVIVVDAKPGTLDMPGSCIFFMLPQVFKVATQEEAVSVLRSLPCEMFWPTQTSSSTMIDRPSMGLFRSLSHG